MIYEVSRDGDTSSSCEECKLENANAAINLNQSSSEEEVLIEGIESISQHRQQHRQHLQHPSSSPALHQQHLIHRLQEENKHLKLIN